MLGSVSNVNLNSFPGERMVVFLAAGQSNMLGRPTYTTGDKFPANTFQINYNTGAIEDVAGASMLDYYSATTETATDMTLPLEFAVQFHNNNPNVKLVFVGEATSGTGYFNNFWNENDSLFDSAVSRVNTFMSKNPHAEFGGILWHQGEADSKNTDGTAYEANFHAMINAFRTNITVADASTPFVCAGFSSQMIADVGSVAQGVNDDIEDLPNNISNTGVAEANDLTTSDNLHFNESSLRTLGGRYYTEWSLLR
jgi:hypothetical protein